MIIPQSIFFSSFFFSSGGWRWDHICLRLREDSAAFGFGLLLGLVLFTVKILRGQNASDILALVTGMSAAGFFYRLIKAKSRKKFDICWASLCTLMTLFFLYRFFVGAP